jgi:hypothetical protein
MTQKTLDEDQISLTLADDLVREMNPTVLGVLHGRMASHAAHATDPQHWQIERQGAQARDARVSTERAE